MDQFNEQENWTGPINPDIDFSAYLANDLDIPSNIPFEDFSERAVKLQPMHDLTIEEFLELDFNIPRIFDCNLPENPIPKEMVTFESSPVRPPEPVISPIDSAPIPYHESGVYQNRVLNSFSSTDIPLSIIDNLKYPFDEELQTALEKELERQRQNSEHLESAAEAVLKAASEDEQGPQRQKVLRQAWQGVDTPYEIIDEDNSQVKFSNSRSQTHLAQIPAESTSIPLSNSQSQLEEWVVKRGKNKRSQNRLNFDPLKYYLPLPSKPASWGPKSRNGEYTFQYTSKGELLPELRLTVTEIGHFIQHNPLNYINGNPVPDPKNSGLIIWVQAVPADSGNRYGNAVSAKCRFKDCPEPHNTIWKGDFRVAFDEQSSQHPKTDPFHCAFYTHLFCMEKFFDFSQICRTFNVQPDTRVLPEGRNKMAITRDHPGMLDVVEDYIQKFSWQGPRPRDQCTEYEHYLNYKLTKYHLQMQPSQKQVDRDKRESMSSIDITINNLEIFVQNKALQNANKKGSSSRQERKRKAKYIEDIEESDLDDDILSRELIGFRSPKRSKWGRYEYNGYSTKPSHRL